MDEFNLQLKLLKFSGFIRNASKRTKKISDIWLYCTYIITFYFWFSASAFAYRSDDILDISEALAPLFTGIFTIVKYVVFQHQFNDFYNAMDAIEDLSMKWIKHENFYKILRDANKACKRFTNFMGYGCLIAGIVITTKPFLSDLIFSLESDATHVRELPYKGEFFFDVQNLPGYQLIYLLQTYITFFIIIFSVTMASIFSCYCLNIAAHFNIMKIIVNDAETKDFLIYHQTVLGVSKKLIRLYKPIIFTEFVIMTIVLCFTGFQILMLDDFVKIVGAMLHAGAAFADVAVYSFGAQKVLDSALVIGDEFYKSDKNYVLILLIVQKELKFDAGLFHASLHTLTVILSRTMSFITLLKSFI